MAELKMIVAKIGADYVSSSLTNQAFGNAIIVAICHSFGMKVSVNKALNSMASLSIAIVGACGRVQMAADAANRLKIKNHYYYSMLYNKELEMLYFLIEPVIQKNNLTHFLRESDNDIASTIIRLLK